jgi:reactive chlorine resistance protein C
LDTIEGGVEQDLMDGQGMGRAGVGMNTNEGATIALNRPMTNLRVSAIPPRRTQQRTINYLTRNQRRGGNTMSAISIGIVQARSALERVVAIEDVGKAIVRWGVVIILAWIGGMKFTAYEAMGIQPLVAHSPLLSWMYGFLSVRSFSTMLGFLEIGTAVLIALRSVSPKASAIGSLLAIGLFGTTLSMLVSTPGWEPSLGFPALSAMPGQFLLKDIVYLGASIWILGESLKALEV